MIRRYLKSLIVICLSLVACNACGIMSLEELFSSQHSVWVYILVSFVAGVMVSFTPCLYPMIPITAGVLQSQKTKNHWHTFFLSLSYVFGIAFVYSLLGYIVATTGGYFGYWLSNPWVIWGLFLFFLYLAGSMFGFYQLKLPECLTKKRVSIKRGGSFVYTFLVGIITGTVASPCVSPALMAILAFVSQSDQPFVGVISLFAFAVGMSLLLLIVGAFSSTIARLPRAGSWMLEVNRVLGFVILFIAVGFILPFIPNFFEPVLYGSILLAAALYYWMSCPAHGRATRVLKIVLASLLLILSLLVFFDPLLCRYNLSFVNCIFKVATYFKGH